MDDRELHPDPSYCEWCGEEVDKEGNCSAPQHCPPEMMDCPVCIDYGKLSGHEDYPGLQCDVCERQFSFYQGVLEPNDPIVITDEDMEGILSRFEDSEDKVLYWSKIKDYVRAWEDQKNG